jgi:hypothetical protein
MSHAGATGVSTGTSLALLWKVLEGASYQPPITLCPPRPWFELHWASVALGLVIGLCLGSVLEALVGFRLLLYQAVIRRLVAGIPAGVQRPLYRIL